MTNRRRPVTQTQSLHERLHAFAQEARARAAGLPSGMEPDQLLQKAREADMASHIEEWVNSSGLQSPT